ncbi:hypothetical protein thsps21_16860 [Pseudomonas sp. No.21]|jgi:hypothetical protein|uniref:phage baseplate protein n=1 Tax=Pseudomonas TaxID=286 RepID=UPI000DA71B68|nr:MULTISPECIES: hypothetical protein [Pseudomonas]MDW3710691.1 hypothetical protein [Pseudomonas sp. 2023EL-01195]PZE12530.1 hypothetical protein DMX10_15390 [Pseudomonas sp. 57B-090624]GJN49136.1 hypothetical protein TUM20249_51220 [Pseudomonas tohonis]
MVMLINRRIGTLRLDAVISETHKSDLKITENPVESGANIADHAYVQPRSLIIKGTVVEHYDPLANLPIDSMPGVRSGRGFLDNILPGLLSPRTSQGESRAKRELKSWLEPLADGTKARPLAPWMLESQPLSRFDSSPSQSRLQQIYQCLLDTQKAGELLQVQTGFYLYKNMLLSTIAATQTLDGSIDLDLTLREVLVVETRVINGVVTPAAGTERSGRSDTQAAAKKPQGKTTPKADKRNESLMHAVLGVVR